MEGEVTTDRRWKNEATADEIRTVTTDGISGRQARKQVRTKGERAAGRSYMVVAVIVVMAVEHTTATIIILAYMKEGKKEGRK